jgi:hypothetical protein
MHKATGKGLEANMTTRLVAFKDGGNAGVCEIVVESEKERGTRRKSTQRAAQQKGIYGAAA